MRFQRVTAAILTVTGLVGCASAQQAARQLHQAKDSAATIDQPAEVQEPSWTVTADCAGIHVVLSGWTNVRDVSPSTGLAYAILGTGDTIQAVGLDQAGNADLWVPVDHSPGTWGWTLLINGDPGLDQFGNADC